MFNINRRFWSSIIKSLLHGDASPRRRRTRTHSRARLRTTLAKESLEDRIAFNVAPIAIAAGSSLVQYDDQNPFLTWIAFDTDNNLSSVSVELIHGGSVVATSAAHSGTFFIESSMGLGGWVLIVKATDSNGLTGVDFQGFSLDDDDPNPPAISLSGASGSQSHVLDQSFSWSVSDASGITATAATLFHNHVPIVTHSTESGTISFNSYGTGLFEIHVSTIDADNDRPGDSLQSSAIRTVTVTNATPTAEAFGPYTVTEGGSVMLSGSGTDGDGESLRYEWDLDNNGSYETSGQQVTFSAAGRDGYSGASAQVRLRVSDGLVSVADTAIVNLTNARPTIHSVTNTGPVDEAHAVAVSVSATDPAGPLDPLSYHFDFDNNGIYELNNGGSATAQHIYPDNGSYQVNVKVTDGDGGEQFSSTTVTVNNVPPTITAVSDNGPVFQGSPVVLTTTAVDAAGPLDPLTYLYDIDGDSVFEVSNSSGKYAHVFFDSGTHRVGVGVRDDHGDTTVGYTDVTVLSVTPPPELPGDLPRASFTTGYRTLVETAGTAEVTARLSKPSDVDVAIPLAFSGTATRRSDYSSTISILIPAGQLTGSTTIQVTDDTLAEGNETIVIRMLPPPNAALSTHPGDPIAQTITIQANDAPIVSFASANLRVSEAGGNFTIVARLSNKSAGRVVVPLFISGTARSPGDYHPLPTAIEFPPDSDEATLSVMLVDDAVAEPQERLVLTMGTPSVVTADGVVEIAHLGPTTIFSLDIDDDDTPRISFATALQDVWEDAATVAVTVQMTNVSSEDVNVPLTIDGTATPGVDYFLPSNTLVIPAGQTSASTTLFIANDLTTENDKINDNEIAYETVKIGLQQPTNALLATPQLVTQYVEVQKEHIVSETVKITTDFGTFKSTVSVQIPTITYVTEIKEVQVNAAPTTHIIPIKDDDPIVLFNRGLRSVFDEALSFGSDFWGVALSARTNKDVTVPVYFSGSATRGSDYNVDATMHVTIPANNLLQSFGLRTTNDEVNEAEETIVISLGTPTNAYRSETTETLSIRDDDTLSVSFAESTATVDEAAGTVQIKAKLSRAADQQVTVPLTFSGSATRELDYTLSGTQIVFPIGQLESSVTLHVKEDSVIELAEQVLINLNTPSRGSLGLKRQTLTILDNDLPRNIAQSTVAGQVAVDTVPHLGPLPPLSNTLPLPSGSELSPYVVVPGTVALAISSGSQLGGGRVFFDANKNRVFDATERSATTELDGSFLMSFPSEYDTNGNGQIEAHEGQLVLAGSVDSSTGLALTSTFIAPVGAYVISPLTTLMSELAEAKLLQGAVVDLFAMSLRVCEALGLPPLDLTRFDPTAQTLDGNLDGAAVYAAQAKLYGTAKQAAALIAGVPDAPPRSVLENLVFQDMAAKAVEAGSLIDLGNEAVVESIIRGVLNAVGLTLNSDIVQGAASVIAAGNRYIAAIPVAANIEYLTLVAQAKKVSQDDVAKDLLLAAVGQTAINTVVDANTGSALAARVAAATVGNVAAPVLRVSSAGVVEGNDSTTWAEFTVTMSGKTRVPVSVDFATADGSAILAEGDYVEASGTLTWNPGDAESKTIRVAINGDVNFESDEYFLVLLSNPTNAVVREYLGPALIVNDDPLTYTAPSDGQVNDLLLEFDEGSMFLTRNGVTVLDATISNAPITIIGTLGVQNNLSVHIANGSILPSGGLTFQGRGDDRLTIQQDQLVQNVAYATTSARAGTIDLDGVPIRYSGVSSMEDGIAAFARQFVLGGAGSQDVTLANGADSADGQSTISLSESGDTLNLSFVNPIESLTVQAGNGSDTIRLEHLDGIFVANVALDAGSGDDWIRVAATTGPGSYTVDGGAGNDDYLATGGTLAAVANVAARVALGDDAVVDEGSNFSRVASFSDPGFDTWTATVDYGDRTGVHPLTLNSDKTFSLNHVYADNGVYTINVTVSDEDGDWSFDELRVTVDNRAPTLDAGANQSTTEGAVVSLSPATFNDLGTLDTHTATINWGDGNLTAVGLVTEAPTGPPGSTAGTNGTINASHTYADNGTYIVTVIVMDDDGGSDKETFTVTVNNIDPTLMVVSNQTVDEGSALSLTNLGIVSDPGFDNALNSGEVVETFTYTINWGDGTAVDMGSATIDDVGSPGDLTDASFDGGHTYADNGTYTVTLTVTDDDGGSDTETFQVTVTNVAPSVAVEGSSLNLDTSGNTVPFSGVRGQTLFFDVSFSDAGFDNPVNPLQIPPGSVEAFTFFVNWGDGTTSDYGTPEYVPGSPGVLTLGSFDTSHIYTQAGTYTASVTVLDDDGAATTINKLVTIKAVAMQVGGHLAVGGTVGPDEIEFSPIGSNQIQVTIGGSALGVYQPVSGLHAFGQAGNDDIQVAGAIHLSAWLYGDSGNDRLKGGAGHDVLLGGLGDDLLIGQSGRDLLIGGHGADRLIGNSDDDILIAGFTAFDYDYAHPFAARPDGLLRRLHQPAISALMAEWTSDRDFAARTANIRNAHYNLAVAGPAPTVFEDGMKDTMTGSEGQDWFFANLESGVVDKITDLKAEEFAGDLEFILS